MKASIHDGKITVQLVAHLNMFMQKQLMTYKNQLQESQGDLVNL